MFSPHRSKFWLSCVWLSLALYLLIGRVSNWSTFEFSLGYAIQFNNPISFISEQHNKSIYNYAARNRVFREEFRKLLCWWQVRRTSTEADSDANARRGRGEEITHTVV